MGLQNREGEWMNKWFGCKLCGLRHGTSLYCYSSSGHLLALPVSSRALDSSARVARKLPFILLSVSLLGDFCRNDLLLPCIQLPFYNRMGLGSHVVLSVTSVVPDAVVDAIVAFFLVDTAILVKP